MSQERAKAEAQDLGEIAKGVKNVAVARIGALLEPVEDR